MKTLRTHLQEYLQLRRRLGFKLRDAGGVLSKFVHFAKQQRAAFVTTRLALRWATQPVHCHPALWTTRLSMPRQFAHYLSAVDPRTEIPPHGLLPHRYRRKAPYLYTDQEVRDLITAARQLPSQQHLRGATYATLFGLLATTGMRVGEALGLDRADVDLAQGLLTVRRTKGNQSRLIPIYPSTSRALRHYERLRDDVCHRPQSPRFFLSERGATLTYWIVRHWFVKVFRQIGLRQPSDRHGPRLHDLRHRFSIQTLVHWYRTDQDVEVHLSELATYLGHRHVNDTYWYLSATPELLQLATRRWKRQEALAQRVLAIPGKRYKTKPVDFLTRAEVEALLAAPNQVSWTGRRDRTLLLVAAQTGLRVSELVGLCCQDVVFGAGAHVRCTGKGRKQRCTPLRKDAVAALRAWLQERHGQPTEPLFPSARGHPLSRDGVEYLLAKHAAVARAHCPSLRAKRVCPHVLRHTLAMELLQAGVDRSVIALWLGHESIETTHIYLHANLELKEKALAKTQPFDKRWRRYRPDDRLLDFLQSLRLCRVGRLTTPGFPWFSRDQPVLCWTRNWKGVD